MLFIGRGHQFQHSHGEWEKTEPQADRLEHLYSWWLLPTESIQHPDKSQLSIDSTLLPGKS